jgi:hypothetical protein
MYASFLRISEALQLDIFHQPLRSRFFDGLKITLGFYMRPAQFRAGLKKGNSFIIKGQLEEKE